jgi:putative NIF3 family GTP cyclohydrolase 1 type 2
MTENPTATVLSEAEQGAIIRAGYTSSERYDDVLDVVTRIVAAHVTATEDRMREAVAAVLDEHAAHHPQIDSSTYYMARVRAALAPTAHDAATMPEVGQ